MKIEQILPSCAVAAETREDRPDAYLFPQERLLVGRAVQKRSQEFATGRACARAALERLGHPPQPILAGERGEPLWPAGVVGSITHCEGYRACALASSTDLLALGIDAEPNVALPDGLLGDIARPEELPRLRELKLRSPEVSWDRLLFSAKESVYKAWYPLTGRWLGFEEAVLSFDPARATFAARLHVARAGDRQPLPTGFCGKWLVGHGLILTAIAVSPRALTADHRGDPRRPSGIQPKVFTGSFEKAGPAKPMV